MIVMSVSSCVVAVEAGAEAGLESMRESVVESVVMGWKNKGSAAVARNRSGAATLSA